MHTKWRLLGASGIICFIIGLPIFFFVRIKAGRMFVVREKWAVLQLRTEMSLKETMQVPIAYS